METYNEAKKKGKTDVPNWLKMLKSFIRHQAIPILRNYLSRFRLMSSMTGSFPSANWEKDASAIMRFSAG